MTIKLFFEAIIKFFLGVILVGLFIFIPAGTINYLNGIIFMIVLFVPMFIAGILMMIFNPKLLASRLNAKEKQKEQGIVIKLSGLMFIAGFVIAGLDYRFNWFELPLIVTYIAAIIFLIGYIIFAEVLRENTYLSRTIKVDKDQQLIDKGLYGLIRHPMYFATILMFISMPLILGSIFSFIIFLIYIPLIAIRAVNEEKVLEKELNGYTEYKKKVKYRIIPFIW